MRSRRPPIHRFAAAMRISVAALALASAPAWAHPTEKVTKPVPALLPLATQFEIASAGTGRTYKIYVSTPVVPAPSNGYAILYVLDADATFPTAASQALLASTMEGGKPIVVVGIGYPDVMASTHLRTRDLSPYLPIAGTDVNMVVKPEDWGGADGFHRFMLDELRPVIDAMVKVDKGDQSLMGYSLGGLFALHVLLTNPEAYRNYVIGSPAIFYTGKKVLEDLPSFAEKIRNGAVSPRILITADELEQSGGPGSLPAHFRMVDNAREAAEALRKIQGRNGYRADYALFPGETHNSGIPAATSRGVAFVGSVVGDARK
ncbi:hypothetical protein K7G82_25095 [Sphingomonas colocasiae]|uniref:Alpha/beta hydrolase n=1 Tax=Sphingomonas colocasiae TaxID=1848973 RepID=A0ABS7PWM3_9SPHN|nr:hypothetical protein [Sphingomonas colocasiae]